jgi:cell wall-associated NlpC family hydrolase
MVDVASSALVPRHVLWRALAVIAATAIALTTVTLSNSHVAGAADYPGLAEIQAAKAAVADARAGVAQLDAAIVELEAAAHAADVAARVAADEYAQAKATSDLAEQELQAASKRAVEAQAALDDARADLAQIAMEAYRAGGSFGSFEAIMSADGFDDVVVRSEAIDRASVHADDTVQRVKAAELVAQTMREYAERAAKQAADAAAAAAAALAAAEEAQRNAAAALAEAQATREEALARLAELRRTSIALERERQRGLTAEREAAEQALWEQSQGGGSGGSSSSGGSSGGGGSSTPETSGSWKSSAAQGQTAVNHALTLMGTPYVAGGEGPGYDCSGLTKVSWGVAGFYLPHSSRSQYAAVAKVSYSELRPGDLIFWGTGRDASKIYHVAIYIGGGKVAEASTYGVPAKTRVYNNWAVGDLMPYAGRV